MSSAELLAALALIAGAYLIGSVPVGYGVCRSGFGIDIFKHGSQRSGTTNVLRTAGLKAAAFVLVGDFLKGFLPALVARALLGQLALVPVLVAFAAIAGHNWSIYLRFRGGRGVTTSWGVVMALAPATALIGVPIGLATLAIARYVSLMSLIAAVGFLIGAIALYALGLGVTGFHLFLIAVINLFLVSQHLDNLRRLFAGTERRLDSWPELIGGRGSRGRPPGR